MTRAYPACLGSDDHPVQTFIARQLFFDGPRRPKSQVVWACAEFIHEFRLAADFGPDQEQTPHFLVTNRNHVDLEARDSARPPVFGRKRARHLTSRFYRRSFVNGESQRCSRLGQEMRRTIVESKCLTPATVGGRLRRAKNQRQEQDVLLNRPRAPTRGGAQTLRDPQRLPTRERLGTGIEPYEFER